ALAKAPATDVPSAEKKPLADTGSKAQPKPVALISPAETKPAAVRQAAIPFVTFPQPALVKAESTGPAAGGTTKPQATPAAPPPAPSRDGALSWPKETRARSAAVPAARKLQTVAFQAPSPMPTQAEEGTE